MSSAERKTKCIKIFKQALAHVWAEKSTLVAISSSFSTNIMFLATYQFGTLVFKQVFKDDDASQDYLDGQLSLYFLIGQLGVIPPIIVYGLIADRFKVWKLVFANHAVMLASLVLFVVSVPDEDELYTQDSPQPVGMTIGFVTSIISASAVYQIQTTLLAKSLENADMSRGLIMGTMAFITSIGVLIISYGGGHLYGVDNRSPAFIAITAESITVLLIIILALCGELRI